MKINTLLTGLCFALWGLSACEPALQVTSDYDKNASFAKYKSFAIDTLRLSQSVTQLNTDRILKAVKAEMVKKGFSESTTPDLLVHISALVKNKQTITANTDYYGYGGFYRPYMWAAGPGVGQYTTYSVDNYKDGSLIIDIADAGTKHLLWEGIGNKEIDKPAKDPETEIATAISSIMASFPPGTGKRQPGQ